MLNESQTPVAAMLASAELTDILVQSFSATLVRLSSVEALNLEIGISWAKRDDALLCRFSAKCLLYDVEENDQNDIDDSHLLARMMCRIVCEYELSDEDHGGLATLESDKIKHFAQEVALPAAFPYIREAMSSMSIRLGFSRITLGMFRPDAGMTFASKPL